MWDVEERRRMVKEGSVFLSVCVCVCKDGAGDE